jgi:hypothetical protein
MPPLKRKRVRVIFAGEVMGLESIPFVASDTSPLLPHELAGMDVLMTALAGILAPVVAGARRVLEASLVGECGIVTLDALHFLVCRREVEAGEIVDGSRQGTPRKIPRVRGVAVANAATGAELAPMGRAVAV